MIGAAIIGIANYSIYMATIDYMITAYGPYSASATGGNGWSRDFLAGVLTIPATPFYTNIGGKKHLQDASTILACIAFVLVIAVYVIYWKGPVLRARSPFAQQLKASKHESGSRRVSVIPSLQSSRRQSYAASLPGSRPNSRPGSRASSRPGVGSRSNTAQAVRERAARANMEMENEKKAEPQTV